MKMAKKKNIDGVVEAVHYGPDGQVDWVRAYLKRGATYSDRTLIKRQSLIDRLKAGEVFFAGERVPYQASTFETTVQIKVITRDGNELIASGGTEANKDTLEGVPVI
jgi:hypothetical protein